MPRSLFVVTAVLGASLVGCRGDVPCCLRSDAGAPCLTQADLPLSSTLASRAVQFGAAGCDQKVCVANLVVGQTTGELKGYCSQQCANQGGCAPGMECMQFAASAADGGSPISVCVHPTDAG
jgi:hypothetical protein